MKMEIAGSPGGRGKFRFAVLSVVAAAMATVAVAVNVERAAMGTDDHLMQSEGLLFAILYKPMAPR